jgi:NADPH2:quinone reductase
MEVGMRAIQITEYGGSDVLKIKEIEIRKPGKGEVLVHNKVAGVNFIDVYQRRGTYKVPLPYVPGLEGAGIVETVGEGVKGVKPGDRVSFLHEPGAYAEYTVVKEDKLIPLPDALSFEQGAAFPLQGMTAHYLLHEFRKIKKGDTVLIHAAAGGMGLLLVQWAKHLGATVFGTVSTEAKAKNAREAGADEIILYTQKNFVEEVKRLTQGKGVELIIDGVGKTTFPGNLEAAALRGNIVVFGAASGAADPISPNVFMGRSLTVSGGSLFNYILKKEEFSARGKAVIEGIQQGWLTLRIEKFPLEKAPFAHQQLEERKTSGKIILMM